MTYYSVLSGITEQDSFDEAGSNEASQFEIDTTRVKSSTVSNPPVRNLDNILADISTKPQLQQEIRNAPFRQEKVEEEEEEHEESPKKAISSQGSSPSNRVTRSRTDVTSAHSKPEPNQGSTGAASTTTAETKKAGFSKLFEKSNKV